MQNATKYALEASLKKFLLKKPVDKITISDLTNDCGISRMSFYYHFKDIYDLVEWACFEDAAQALQGKKTHDTWQEGLMQIFEAVMENKPFILNVYHALSRDQIESYLFHLTYNLIEGVVEEKSTGMNVTKEQKQFVAACCFFLEASSFFFFVKYAAPSPAASTDAAASFLFVFDI